MAKAANSQRTAKKPRGKGKPFVKDDPRINRAGRAKTGQSWSEILAEVWDQYPEELLNLIPNGPLAAGIKQYPQRVQVKYLVAVRITQALLFDPTPGLLTEALNRLEGKVKDQLQVDGALDVEGLNAVLRKVYSGKGEDQSR